MRNSLRLALAAATVLIVSSAHAENASTSSTSSSDRRSPHLSPMDARVDFRALQQIHKGRQIFRYETFADEAFWGGILGLHEAIAGAAKEAQRRSDEIELFQQFGTGCRYPTRGQSHFAGTDPSWRGQPLADSPTRDRPFVDYDAARATGR